MKNIVFTFLAALALITLQAQQTEINFDDGYLEWLEIDTTNPNNCWQIKYP